ncbi:hypothetical protein EVAR_43640_1 [Eumeta japonica]|uniref:Uncharacterized protein n=1 Tax=Eumeta variegata TaxID=151549 RepID=A0A4C1ZM80_EUMVA|nr:hypothetical protein EVAR_43640_1 [Eumeta japonica]
MLWPIRLHHENELAQPMRCHTVTEYRREVTAAAVTFRPQNVEITDQRRALLMPLLLTSVFKRERVTRNRMEGA